MEDSLMSLQGIPCQKQGITFKKQGIPPSFINETFRGFPDVITGNFLLKKGGFLAKIGESL